MDAVAAVTSESTALVPQPHGGALLPGGTGAGGRPPNAVRERLREAAWQRVEVLEAIADGTPVQKMTIGEGDKAIEALVSACPADRIRAIDTMLKYGVGVNATLDAGSGDGTQRQVIVIGNVTVTF